MWDSNPRLGGSGGSPFQASGGMKHPAIKGLRPLEHHAGHFIRTKEDSSGSEEKEADLYCQAQREEGEAHGTDAPAGQRAPSVLRPLLCRRPEDGPRLRGTSPETLFVVRFAIEILRFQLRPQIRSRIVRATFQPLIVVAPIGSFLLLSRAGFHWQGLGRHVFSLEVGSLHLRIMSCSPQEVISLSLSLSLSLPSVVGPDIREGTVSRCSALRAYVDTVSRGD